MRRRSQRAEAPQEKHSGRRLRRRYLTSQAILGILAAFVALVIGAGLRGARWSAGFSNTSSDPNRLPGLLFSGVILAVLIWIMVRRHLDVSRRYTEGDPIPPNRDERASTAHARARRRILRRLGLYAAGIAVAALASAGLVSAIEENVQPTYWGTFRASQEICGGHRTSPSICHSYGTFDSDDGRFHFLRVRFDDSNVDAGDAVRAAYTPHVVLADASTVKSSGPSWWHLLLPGLLDLVVASILVAAFSSDVRTLRTWQKNRRHR